MRRCFFLAGQVSGFSPNYYRVENLVGRTNWVSSLSLVPCPSGSRGEFERGEGASSPKFVSSEIGSWYRSVGQLGTAYILSPSTFFNLYPYQGYSSRALPLHSSIL